MHALITLGLLSGLAVQAVAGHHTRGLDLHQLNATNNFAGKHPTSLHRRDGHLHKRTYGLAIQQDAAYVLQMATTGNYRLTTSVTNGAAYDYLEDAGRGVNVYVVDSGIRITHRLFQGRARHFGNLSDSDQSPYVDEEMNDLDGHGTHVAGTIGAYQYGVAPHVTLVNVKVFAGAHARARSSKDITRAINDITAEHNANKDKARADVDDWAFRGSVINLSFSGPIDDPLFEMQSKGPPLLASGSIPLPGTRIKMRSTITLARTRRQLASRLWMRRILRPIFQTRESQVTISRQES